MNPRKRAIAGLFLLAAGCTHHVPVANPPALLEFASSHPLLYDDEQTRTRLRQGERITVSEPTGALQSGEIQHHEIQHWTGAVFVPAITLDQAIPILKNYSNRSRYMRPEIAESRELSHHGDDFLVYLKMVEKSILPATFDVVLRIHFKRLSATELHIDSRSVSVTDDRGLLQALNHSWRLKQMDSGLYIECEALTLSRKPPPAIAFLADRWIAQAARKTLIETLSATRRMLESETRTSDGGH